MLLQPLPHAAAVYTETRLIQRGINKLDTKTALALKEHIYGILYPMRYRNVKNVLQTRYSYFIQCHIIINASCTFIVIPFTDWESNVHSVTVQRGYYLNSIMT